MDFKLDYEQQFNLRIWSYSNALEIPFHETWLTQVKYQMALLSYRMHMKNKRRGGKLASLNNHSLIFRFTDTIAKTSNLINYAKFICYVRAFGVSSMEQVIISSASTQILKHRLEINAIDLQNAFPKTSFQIKVRTHFSLETLFNVFLDCVRTTQRLINELQTVANFEIDKLTP